MSWRRLIAAPEAQRNERTGHGCPLPFPSPDRAMVSQAVGEPTEVQEKAWPEIAAGAHVLVSAPTGTGKTLAAFLWGIDGW